MLPAGTELEQSASPHTGEMIQDTTPEKSIDVTWAAAADGGRTEAMLDRTPVKSRDALSLPDSLAQVCSDSRKEALVELHSSKELVVGQLGDWLQDSKRQSLLDAVAAQFQARLQGSLEDSQRCRSFWQHAHKLGVGLSVKEVPRRLRLHLSSMTMQNYELRLSRWLQGSIAFQDDAKMSLVMLNVLNELIIAAHTPDSPKPTLLASVAQPVRVDGGKRKIEKVSTVATAGQAKLPRIHKLDGGTAYRMQQNVSSKSQAEKAELVPKLIKEVAAVLTKWHLALMKRSKDDLSTGAAKLASHYARVLAECGPIELAHDLQANGDMFGILAFAIHKLVQLAASSDATTKDSHMSSCYYFLRLSGDSLVQVELLCFSAVSAAVNLLAILWPQGFSDFQLIEDMPKPPTPCLTGRLSELLAKDAHLYKYGSEFNRRLMKEIDQGTDSLILCSACASLEGVLEVFRQGTEHQTAINSRHAAQLQTLSAGAVDLVEEESIGDANIAEPLSGEVLAQSGSSEDDSPTGNGMDDPWARGEG